jgi:hypothetical protein
MTHFGKPKVGGKFYYGDPRDTPWNRDLLWVKFVGKEETDLTKPQHERRMGEGRAGTQVAEVVRPKTNARAASASRLGTSSGRDGAGGGSLESTLSIHVLLFVA